MWSPSLPCIFWLTLAIQLVSVVTIIVMHQSAPGGRRRICQRVFFALMVAIGGVTVLAVSTASHSWMTSGATLSVMTVCATLDPGKSGRQRDAW